MTGVLAAILAAAAVVLALGRVRPPARVPAPHQETGAPTSDRPASPERPRSGGRALAVLAAVAGVVALLAAGPLPMLAGAGLVWLRRVARRRRQARQHRLTVVAAVAETSDLLVAAVRAGLTPHEALRRIGPALPEPVRGAVAEVLARTAHGERLADALDRLPATIGEPARPLARALASADRHGTALAPALELLAVEARAERRRRGEEAARRLPVRLSFPLVACFLPALALCTVVPLLAGTIASLRL